MDEVERCQHKNCMNLKRPLPPEAKTVMFCEEHAYPHMPHCGPIGYGYSTVSEPEPSSSLVTDALNKCEVEYCQNRVFKTQQANSIIHYRKCSKHLDTGEGEPETPTTHDILVTRSRRSVRL